ncbi:MAG: type II secretion system protein [Planctomycetota bacterium]
MPNQFVHRITLRRGSYGFTLIELLVVVAIIALLVSILLPSLKKARDQAKAVVCGNQMSQMVRAEITYEEQYKGWIPGTPFSTGFWFVANPAGTNGGNWMAGVNGQPKITGWFDWFTPLRVEMSGSKSIPNDRIGIFKLGMEGPFNCPSNPHIAIWEEYTTTGETQYPGPPLRAISYLPMQNLMLPARSAVPSHVKALPEYQRGVNELRLTQNPNHFVQVPPSYQPKRSKLGRPSVKVFLAEGTRRFDLATRAIYYKTPMRCSRGGIYPRTAPCDAILSKMGEFWRGAWGPGRKLSFRHGDNNKMNAVFFDGHVQNLWVNFANQRDFNDAGFPSPNNSGSAGYRNFTGPAVTPYYYYPSGSIVNRPERLHKYTTPPGIELQ